MTRGTHKLVWLAFPFVKRNRILADAVGFQDRPDQIIDLDPAEFCKQHGIEYRECFWDNPDGFDAYYHCDVYLHCTSKIIPPAFIKETPILNVHPGMLPKNRGVDAFKWAIVNGWQTGVTLHAIDEEIDRGIILYRSVVPVLMSDALRDLAARAYAFECDLLANFDSHIDNIKRNWIVGDNYPISHRRVPLTIDRNLSQIFLEQQLALMKVAA